ncbi:MAG: alpha-amylase family glycosyl hydrolase [Verrucomicrobiota bacterium]
MGDFNDWNSEAHPLKWEKDGLWMVEVPGAKPGQQYQFEIANGEKRFKKSDAYARAIHSETALSVIYADNFQWKFPGPVLANWNDLVLYELHVGTFAGGPHDAPGRFEQVAARLPYLKNLGVNAIEIMPPMAFPGERSWGYSLTNPFAVEGSYGDPDGLKRLIDAAHGQGIGIILDVVYNHFGPRQPRSVAIRWVERERSGRYLFL